MIDRIKSRWASGVFALCLAATTGTTSPRAQSDFKFALPAETILYVGISDIKGALDEFKSSPLYKIWRDDEVQEFFEEALEEAGKYFEMGKAQLQQMHEAGILPVGPDDLLKLRLQGLHLAVTDLGIDPVSGPKVSIILCIDLGQSGKIAESAIDSLINMAKMMGAQGAPAITSIKVAGYSLHTAAIPNAPPFVTLNLGVVGGKLLIGTNTERMTEIIKRLGGEDAGTSLVKDKVYSLVSKKIRAKPSSFEMFVRPDKWVDAGLEALQMGAQWNSDLEGVDVAGVARAVEVLGLRSVTGFGASSAYEGSKAFARSFAYMPEDGIKGLAKNLEFNPLELEHLSFVPKDAANFSMTSGMGLDTFYTVVMDAIDAYDPEIGKKLRGDIAEFEEQVEFSIKKDLLGGFGPEFIGYQLPLEGAAMPTMVFLVECAAAKKTLQVLKTLAGLTEGNVELTESTSEGRTFYGIELPAELDMLSMMIDPSFSFHKGYLVFALTRADVRMAMEQMDGTGGGDIRSSESFKAYAAELRQDLISLSFNDTAASFSGMYDTVSGMAQMIPLPDDIPIDLGLLPSSEVFSEHLFGALSTLRKVEGGYYNESISPFGPEVVVALSAVIGAGVGVYVFRAADMRRGDGGPQRFKMPAPVMVPVLEDAEEAVEETVSPKKGSPKKAKKAKKN